MNISTKYNINDKFYIMDDNKIKKATIKGISINIEEVKYFNGSHCEDDIRYRMDFYVNQQRGIYKSMYVNDTDEDTKFFTTKEKLVQSLLEEEKDADVSIDNIDDDEDW